MKGCVISAYSVDNWLCSWTCLRVFIGSRSILTFSSMYRLNTRAGVLPRSASSHFYYCDSLVHLPLFPLPRAPHHSGESPCWGCGGTHSACPNCPTFEMCSLLALESYFVPISPLYKYSFESYLCCPHLFSSSGLAYFTFSLSITFSGITLNEQHCPGEIFGYQSDKG